MCYNVLVILNYTFATLGKEYGNHTFSCGSHLLNPEDEKCGTPCLYYGEEMKSGVCDGKGYCVKRDRKPCAVEMRQSLKVRKGNLKPMTLVIQNIIFNSLL